MHQRNEEGSFRDPSGKVFYRNGNVYRLVNKSYKENYDYWLKSGLADLLVKKAMMVGFGETITQKGSYRTLEVEKVPVITYPFEWCFGQLKQAALLTIKIQKLALERGMSLKDASAYNIQFIGNRPVFIDLLSFEKYAEGKPWVAYRQFCQHFLAPLALMSLTDIRLASLMKSNVEGIPLDLAWKLLPGRKWFSFGLVSHIFLNSKAYEVTRNREEKQAKYQLSINGLKNILNSLEMTIDGLNFKEIKTVWGNYYQNTNYSSKSIEDKKKIVGDYVRKIQPKSVLDLGANTGVFSLIAAKAGAYTVSADYDPVAIEKSYASIANQRLLPVVMDLMNPNVGAGWAGIERKSFLERYQSEMVLALALVHHLAIANNLPLEMIARHFAQMGKYLVVEFIPKDDSQVKRLLAQREDIFPDYDQNNFEKVFGGEYKIVGQQAIKGSSRTVYLMERR